MGQITNENGIVLEARVMDGNTSDSEWNGYAIEHVRQVQQALKTSAPLIADSKLICQEHVKTLLKEGIQFISRCPANYHQKLAGRITRKAYGTDAIWQDLGRVGQGKNASNYQGQAVSGTHRRQDRVRLLVLQSSSLVEKVELSLAKEKEELLVKARQLEQKIFRCEADVEEELKRFKKITDSYATRMSGKRLCRRLSNGRAAVAPRTVSQPA